MSDSLPSKTFELVDVPEPENYSVTFQYFGYELEEAIAKKGDAMQVVIQFAKVLDTTALGAAYLAALGVGVFSELSEVTQGWSLDRKFEPEMDQGEVDRRVGIWRDAVKKA